MTGIMDALGIACGYDFQLAFYQFCPEYPSYLTL